MAYNTRSRPRQVTHSRNRNDVALGALVRTFADLRQVLLTALRMEADSQFGVTNLCKSVTALLLSYSDENMLHCWNCASAKATCCQIWKPIAKQLANLLGPSVATECPSAVTALADLANATSDTFSWLQSLAQGSACAVTKLEQPEGPHRFLTMMNKNNKQEYGDDIQATLREFQVAVRDSLQQATVQYATAHAPAKLFDVAKHLQTQSEKALVVAMFKSNLIAVHI